jgi:hypothetical protein
MENDNEPWRFAERYAPALTAVALGVLQAAVLRCPTAGPKDGEERPVRLDAERWMDPDSRWDDVAFAGASAAMLTALCAQKMTRVAWWLLAPTVVLGTITTASVLVGCVSDGDAEDGGGDGDIDDGDEEEEEEEEEEEDGYEDGASDIDELAWWEG